MQDDINFIGEFGIDLPKFDMIFVLASDGAKYLISPSYYFFVANLTFFNHHLLF